MLDELGAEARRVLGSMTEPVLPPADAGEVELLRFQRDTQRYFELKSLALAVIKLVATLPADAPVPRFPAADASPQQLAAFVAALQKLAPK